MAIDEPIPSKLTNSIPTILICFLLSKIWVLITLSPLNSIHNLSCLPSFVDLQILGRDLIHRSGFRGGPAKSSRSHGCLRFAFGGSTVEVCGFPGASADSCVGGWLRSAPLTGHLRIPFSLRVLMVSCPLDQAMKSLCCTVSTPMLNSHEWELVFKTKLLLLNSHIDFFSSLHINDFSEVRLLSLWFEQHPKDLT